MTKKLILGIFFVLSLIKIYEFFGELAKEPRVAATLIKVRSLNQ